VLFSGLYACFAPLEASRAALTGENYQTLKRTQDCIAKV
jgi:hypothetical protein